MMRRRIEEAVAAIFESYDDTPQMRDFREEITVNLLDRVADIVKHGASEAEAVNKALEELGDITEIADSIGKQKRKEAIEDYYLSSRPLDKKHAAGYSIAGALTVFGLVAAFVSAYQHGTLSKVLIVFLPFGIVSVCSFVYLALTQETSMHYPVTGKRGALYAVAAGLLFLGAFLGGAAVFRNTALSSMSFRDITWLKAEMIAKMPGKSAAILLGMILPGAAMLSYLIMTQEKRLKPWAAERQRHYYERYSGECGERFGTISGAIWTFAIALFVLLGFLVGWHPAWIVFLFAVSGQMLAMVFFRNKT